MSKSDLFKLVSFLSLSIDNNKLPFNREMDFIFNNIDFTICWTIDNKKFIKLKNGTNFAEIKDQIWTPDIMYNNLKKLDKYSVEFKIDLNKKDFNIKLDNIAVVDLRN